MTDKTDTNKAADTLLPDTGNQMSERSGDYTESDSAPMPEHQLDGQELPQGVDNDGSGTTFDGGSAVPGSTF